MSDALPITRWMQICLGMIGMSPREFWDCSPQEIYQAIAGFLEFNTDQSKEAPMSRGTLNELMELYPD